MIGAREAGSRLLREGVFLLLLVVTAGAMGAAPAGYGHSHKGTTGDSFPVQDTARVATPFFDSNGRLWLSWAHGAHVYVNFSDDQGRNFSEPVVVNSRPEKIYSNGEARPKIAVDRGGRIYVAWTRKLDKRFTGHIRFSRSLDGGQSFSPPLTVNDNLDIISHRFVSMLLDDKGHIHLAWLDGRKAAAAKKAGQEYEGSSLYYSHSDDHGQHFASNRLLADNVCQCCRLAMDLDARRRPVVLWRHIFQNEVDGKKTVARDHGLMSLQASGRLEQPRRVSFDNWATDSCPHHGPSMVTDDQGRLHMTWFNLKQGRAVLSYGFSDDAGDSVQGLMSFNGDDTQAQHPYLAISGKRVVLAWKTFDGKRSRIMVRQSLDRGQSWGEDWQLADSAVASDHPLLLAHDGRIWLSWLSQDHGYRFIEVAK